MEKAFNLENFTHVGAGGEEVEMWLRVHRKWEHLDTGLAGLFLGLPRGVTLSGSYRLSSLLLILPVRKAKPEVSDVPSVPWQIPDGATEK